jgi:nucleotide-binding universal stress UspA family protein
LIKQVLREGHDLVLKSAQGTSRAKLLLFGSTDMHLMRKCPCPVWMLGPERSEKAGGVLAAVDPDSMDDVKQALNTTVMELATSLAILEEVELHVVHAWRAPYEDTLRHSPFLRASGMDADRHVAEMASRHEKGLNDLVAGFEKVAPDMNVHLVEGAPWETIPALAEESDIEVIVMGTVCRTGLAGLIMGNTAEELLNRVGCSVLAIKPKGFVSPVTLDTT